MSKRNFNRGCDKKNKEIIYNKIRRIINYHIMSNSTESNQTDRQSVQSQTATPSKESNITNCNSSTSIGRDERHPLMDQTIAIDNNTLTSIINSIIQPQQVTKTNNNNNISINDGKNAKVDVNANLNESNNNNNNNNNNNKQGKNENNQSQQSYLLPVDLLITMDKQTNKPTVQAALPSTFAFQQPMTLPFLPSIPMSLASIPTTPATTINTAAAVSYQPPLTPQMPLMSMPMPSIPMSLLSQPQILPTQQLLQQQQQQQQQQKQQINNYFNLNQLHQTHGSTLNPSAASFTPSTTYSAFGQAMNVITPISEHCNEEKVREQDESINDEQDAWYMIDAKQEKTRNNNKTLNANICGNSYKPPIPTHNHQTMDHQQTRDKPPPSTDANSSSSLSPTHTIMSPSFHKRKSWRNNGHEINEDSRKYGKSWRNFGNKRENLTPPRWRNNNNDKSIKPNHLHLNLSYHSRKSHEPFPTKPIKLLVEFVKHVTLPNRENYPPNTILTKTWYD